MTLIRENEDGSFERHLDDAIEARERGDYDQAEEILLPEAEAGDTYAMYELALIAAARGDEEGWLAWLEKAARAGSSDAGLTLAHRAEESGDRDAALGWLVMTRDDDPFGHLLELIRLARADGESPRLRHLLTQLCEMDDSVDGHACLELAELCELDDDFAEARRWRWEARFLGMDENADGAARLAWLDARMVLDRSEEDAQLPPRTVAAMRKRLKEYAGTIRFTGAVSPEFGPVTSPVDLIRLLELKKLTLRVVLIPAGQVGVWRVTHASQLPDTPWPPPGGLVGEDLSWELRAQNGRVMVGLLPPRPA